MRRNKRGKRKKGDRMRSRQTGKNPRMCGGKSALVVAAFQGIPNYFIFLLHLGSSTFQELRMRYQNQHFCRSQSNGILIEVRGGVVIEQLLITGMYNLQNCEYFVMQKGKVVFLSSQLSGK